VGGKYNTRYVLKAEIGDDLALSQAPPGQLQLPNDAMPGTARRSSAKNHLN